MNKRISEIRRLSAPGKWNHVRTKEDPADLRSRGMSIEDLAQSDIWWYGSENLRNGNEVLVRLTLKDPQKCKKRKSFKLS